MSETNQNHCEPGKHHYDRHESVIYCVSCGDVKSLVLSVPTTTEIDKFETARKFFFKHGCFPKKAEDGSKASLTKLFQSVTKDKYNVFVLNDVHWKNTEESAMFIAIIMVTPEGGYFVDVHLTKYSVDDLRQRVEFHLECFTKSSKLGWSGMRFDTKENRLEVLMKGATNTNTLLIFQDASQKEKEKETTIYRFNRAKYFLIEKKQIVLDRIQIETMFWATLPLDQIDDTYLSLNFDIESEERSNGKTEAQAMAVAIHMVARSCKEIRITVDTKEDVQRFVAKVFFHLECFKGSDEFGWTREPMCGGHGIFAIKVTKTGEITSFITKCRALERFDKACDYFVKHGKYGWLDSELLILQKIRTDLIKGDFKEAMFHTVLDQVRSYRNYIMVSVVAILMVSQLPESPFVIIDKQPAEFVRLVHTCMKIFTDSEEFGWVDVDFYEKNPQFLFIMNKKLQKTAKLHVSPPKMDVPEIVEEISKHYETQRNIIADENQRDMDAILKLCQTKLLPGQYLELSEKEYPRLAKDPFMFEHFLKRRGYWLSCKSLGHHFIVTCPHF